MAEDADYGTDISMFVGGVGAPDLDPNFREITGPEAVAQNVALRCYTPREGPGSLIGADNDGVFLPDFQQVTLDKQSLFVVQTLVAGEARKDARVEQARVKATRDLANQTLYVDVKGTTAEGPFELTLAASADDFTARLREDE